MFRGYLIIAALLTFMPLVAVAQTTRPATPATAPSLAPVARFVKSEVCPANGGHYYETEWGLPMTNVWAVPSYFGRELIGIPVALIGLVVARRTLRLMRRRWRIGEPHCRRCGYCLTNLASDRCPECGTGLTARTRVIAGPVRRRVAIGLLVATPLLLAYPAMHFAQVGRVSLPLWPKPQWSLGLGTFLEKHLKDTEVAKALVLQGSRIVEKDFNGNTVRAFDLLPARILFIYQQVHAGSLIVHIDSYGPECRYLDPDASVAVAKSRGLYQWARWDPATGKLIAHRTFGFDGEAWTDGRQVYLIPSKPGPFPLRQLEPPAWRCYDATTGQTLQTPAWLADGPAHACLPEGSPLAFTLDWTGRTVRTYDKTTGKLAASMNLGEPQSDPDCPSSISVTPDGSLILVKRYGVPAELYDVQTRRLLRTFERDTFEGTTPTLKYFAMSVDRESEKTCTMEIRELRTDRLVARVAGTGPARRVDVRFSPDERHVYCLGLNWANTKEWAVFEIPADPPVGDR